MCGILFCFSSFIFHCLNLLCPQEAEMQGDIIRVLVLWGVLHLVCGRHQEQTCSWVRSGCSVTLLLSAWLSRDGCISLPKPGNLIGQLFCSHSYLLLILPPFLPLMWVWAWQGLLTVAVPACVPTLPWFLLALAFFVHVCMHAKLLWPCLILCDFLDCSSPGSSVYRVVQARILRWVAMLSSRESSWPWD